MNSTKIIFFCVLVLLTGSSPALAQMERTRVVQDNQPVDDIFLAGSIAGLSTAISIPKNNMNTSVMHNFGLISGGIDSFYGLDAGAAVRLGIDYGITDRLDVGIGRSSLEDNVDLRFKYVILHQLNSGKIPVHISLKTDIGVSTQNERRFDYTFSERLNYLASLMIARKFTDAFSAQMSPMVAHFNTVVKETESDELHHTFYGLGFAGRYKLNARNALAFEYLPALGPRNDGYHDHMAIVFEIDTGGHVFQLFLMSGRWFTEQHLLSRTQTDFTDLDFRFGFNINRVFGL
ncbi:DUF5777 family beta-barrel protein [Gracilimonas mengyeensis]|uniref:DUF5777 domain-containing protein n=1 Tax=Gracilimonas mengyeensis TaxID=1302730 RepID=A0A521AIE9_9BACT|nr:DUF5777 family beta-barrel protein [Gracilimonas mengyeensis]SMO34614.1 hypothetical protein SAMN06265219_101174 [Gracilimonas mengyeensis]